MAGEEEGLDLLVPEWLVKGHGLHSPQGGRCSTQGLELGINLHGIVCKC